MAFGRFTTMAVIAQSRLRQSWEMAQSLAAACLLIACSTGAPVSTMSPNPAGESWTMYRGDLVRDGHPPGATLDDHAARRLRSAWRAHVGGAVDGTPAVTGGLVIAGGADGTLVALDSRSGRTVWSRNGLAVLPTALRHGSGRAHRMPRSGRRRSCTEDW